MLNHHNHISGINGVFSTKPNFSCVGRFRVDKFQKQLKLNPFYHLEMLVFLSPGSAPSSHLSVPVYHLAVPVCISPGSTPSSHMTVPVFFLLACGASHLAVPSTLSFLSGCQHFSCLGSLKGERSQIAKLHLIYHQGYNLLYFLCDNKFQGK